MKISRVTDADVDEFLTRHAAGEAMHSIAADTGWDTQTVRYHLKKAGVDTSRGGTRTVDDEAADEAVAMYQRGVNVAFIASHLGLGSTSMIYTLLKQRGLPRRGKSTRAVPTGSTHIDQGGYVVEKVAADWPYLKDMSYGGGGGGRWIRQHRKVMAEKLGRALTARDQVHHVNGDRTDNRPENLQLRQGAHGTGTCWRCADCGSTNLEPTDL